MAIPAAPTHLLAAAVSSTLSAPTITTTSLPQAKVGISYSATLTATGGLAPYTWSINDGALPPGLSLSKTGSITGSPTASGTFKFTALVTDALKQTASLAVSMVH